jgi:hypothetical protein
LLSSLISENGEKIRREFRDKRREHNAKLYKDGGSPDTEALCPATQPLQIAHVKGKTLLSIVRGYFQASRSARVEPMNVAVGSDLAPDLKRIITGLMN